MLKLKLYYTYRLLELSELIHTRSSLYRYIIYPRYIKSELSKLSTTISFNHWLQWVITGTFCTIPSVIQFPPISKIYHLTLVSMFAPIRSWIEALCFWLVCSVWALCAFIICLGCPTKWLFWGFAPRYSLKKLKVTFNLSYDEKCHGQVLFLWPLW